MTSRKEIRDTVKAAIEADNPQITAFTDNHIAVADEVVPLAVVSLSAGRVSHDIPGNDTVDADLIVEFYQSGSDDDVDIIADSAITALFNSSALRQLLVNARTTGFSYDQDDQDSSISSIAFEIEVQYHT